MMAYLRLNGRRVTFLRTAPYHRSKMREEAAHFKGAVTKEPGGREREREREREVDRHVRTVSHALTVAPAASRYVDLLFVVDSGRSENMCAFFSEDWSKGHTLRRLVRHKGLDVMHLRHPVYAQKTLTFKVP
ncbi:hypothetical protein KIPB_004148 [Kipferlia bialata]|uniref:Uncharacterized protein n=1 Tax=Kipferlia bialata TaxID=797122 RepID=A0A9K3GFS4_9EUKA|nr:hypothetical protein KIPB_001258 [Kipferlia bialata]GIQ82921.1 hypothetical protein KIPB_004148 [Kipferlia bialata]|eukprot:g1258.t1